MLRAQMAVRQRFVATHALDAEVTDVPIETREIENHDHNYYRRSVEINDMAWKFLSPKHLDADARYRDYKITKNGDNVSIEPVTP